MPRDVRTRWNATYDMLHFAYEYKEAINQITDRREMKLRDYEVEPHEWDSIKQLRDVLGVSTSIYSFFFLTYHTSITGF
jgi:DNA-binding transcriptional regulator YiaG